jgi:hypothetical protein
MPVTPQPPRAAEVHPYQDAPCPALDPRTWAKPFGRMVLPPSHAPRSTHARQEPAWQATAETGSHARYPPQRSRSPDEPATLRAVAAGCPRACPIACRVAARPRPWRAQPHRDDRGDARRRWKPKREAQQQSQCKYFIPQVPRFIPRYYVYLYLLNHEYLSSNFTETTQKHLTISLTSAILSLPKTKRPAQCFTHCTSHATQRRKPSC